MSTPYPPASAGDVLGSAGTPLTITFRGAKHPVSPADLSVVDRVEKLIAARKMEAAHDLAKALPPKDARRILDRVGDRLADREHATGGDMWASEMGAKEGVQGLLLILFACLERARESSADAANLPPPIAFQEMAKMLTESPDAQTVAALLMSDFTRALGNKLDLPPETIRQMLDGLQSAMTKVRKAEPSAA